MVKTKTCESKKITCHQDHCYIEKEPIEKYQYFSEITTLGTNCHTHKREILRKKHG